MKTKTINERVFEDFGSPESLKEFLFPNVNEDLNLFKKINNDNSSRKIIKIDTTKNINEQLKFKKIENDELIEMQFSDNKPYVIGKFNFYVEDITPSNATSFRRCKPIKFIIPIITDLPIDENADNNEIYEVIGESLKNDFIMFIKENILKFKL